MRGTLTKICRAGLLSSFIFISYIAVTSSMTLDLTELRNKISKIKVNPRGNLWATGKRNNTLSGKSCHALCSFSSRNYLMYYHFVFIKGISWARKVLWIVPLWNLPLKM